MKTRIIIRIKFLHIIRLDIQFIMTMTVFLIFFGILTTTSCLAKPEDLGNLLQINDLIS